MQTFTIPVTWRVSGELTIGAENLEKAIEMAYACDSLPDGSYIDDSFQVEREDITCKDDGQLSITELKLTYAEGLISEEEYVSRKLEQEEILIITDGAKAPVCLSSRYGEWITRRDPLVDKLYDKFEVVENEQNGTLRAGDPRLFMGGLDYTFVAKKEGLVGILAEVELECFEGEPDFQKVLEEKTKKLVDLQDAFPYSDIYVAYGEPTFEGRLTLCAFTPLIGQKEMYYGSPYPDASEISALTAELVRIAYGERESQSTKNGRIWWIADNEEELDQWKKEWEGKPITIVTVEHHNDGSTRMDVVFELEKEKANELLGYEVEESEWLEEDGEEEGTSRQMTAVEIAAIAANPPVHCLLCSVPIPANCPHIKN